MTESEKSVDRRKLLRRGGIVAAGVAGAGVAGAVAATPAQAAPGQPVVQGENNNAGTDAVTQVQSTGATAPTLVLDNQYEVADGVGTAAGPSLRLMPHGSWLNNAALAGSISADLSGLPWVSVEDSLGPWSYAVHTDYNSNRIVPVTPTRVVDTRNATGRQYIMNPSGNLDSAGRVLGGRQVNIDLSDLVYFPDAVLLNATVVGSVGAGFLTLWAYNTDRPNVSSLNYSGVTLSNFVFSASGWNLDQGVDAGLSVFVNTTTHVILDVVGYVISVGYVYPPTLAAGQSASAAANKTAAERARLARAGKPKWQK